MTQLQLIQHLQQWISHLQNASSILTDIDLNTLNFKLTETSWSATQCIEHLNKYNQFYVPTMQMQLAKAKTSNTFKDTPYKIGSLGNWFSNQMKPEKAQLKSKMASPKNKRPSLSTYNYSVIKTHINYLNQYVQILEEAQQINLNKNNIPITLTRFIKMKFGDTLRFNIYHMLRHTVQYEKTLKTQIPNFNNIISQTLLETTMW